MNLFDNDTTSINEGARNPLKIGRHPYRIVTAKRHDKDGQTSLIFGLKHIPEDSTHSLFLGVSAPGDTGRIAKQTTKGLWDATGLQGNPGIDRLPNFVDKVVEIDAYENTGKDGALYVNVRGVYPYNGNTPGPALTTMAPQHSADDALPGVSDTQDNPLSETPPAKTEAAAAPATKKRWPGARK